METSANLSEANFDITVSKRANKISNFFKRLMPAKSNGIPLVYDHIINLKMNLSSLLYMKNFTKDEIASESILSYSERNSFNSNRNSNKVNRNYSIFRTFTGKMIILMFLLISLGTLKVEAASQNKATGISLSAQSGSLTYGTSGTATYTCTLMCDGGTKSGGTSTQVITWTAPAGTSVYYNGVSSNVISPALLSIVFA